MFKSNFARIAENTTKYYLELRNNYGSKFSDEASLLTTAGVLYAQNYIFIEHSIDVDTIILMAKKALGKRKKDVTDYIRLKVQQTMSSHEGLLKLLTEGNEFEEDPLFNFIFSLEVALFRVDNPRFSSSDIELACFKKANTISNATPKTKEKYEGEARFISVVASFMESPEFRQVRKQLGINE